MLVSEVGPRDGLQSIGRAMPTEARHRWIRALAAAGAHKVTLSVSASHAHSLSNIRMTCEQAARRRPGFRHYPSSSTASAPAFDCPCRGRAGTTTRSWRMKHETA